MDFARIDPRRDAERGATLHLYDPYEPDPKKAAPLYLEPGKPIRITVLGLDSKAGRVAAARMVKETGGGKGIPKDENGEPDIAAMDEGALLAMADKNEGAQARMIAALTTGWENVVYLPDDQMDDPEAEPAPLKCTPANAELLYSTRPWILQEVAGFLADKRNFIAARGKA